MNYNFWLEGRKIDQSKLAENGFETANGGYFCRVDLPNGIYISVKITSKVSPRAVGNATSSEPALSVNVFDSFANKKYAPFYNGHCGAALKAEVREKVLNLLQNCLI